MFQNIDFLFVVRDQLGNTYWVATNSGYSGQLRIIWKPWKTLIQPAQASLQLWKTQVSFKFLFNEMVNYLLVDIFLLLQQAICHQVWVQTWIMMDLVESLIDDEDFKAKESRKVFEILCADLWERVGNPLKQLLEDAFQTMVC